MNRLLKIALLAVALTATGCAHQVSFEDVSYAVDTPQQAAGVVAVIDQETLDNVVSIRSFMTGIAHSWDARPGEMLKQVSAVELPQMFERYELSTTYREPSPGGRDLTLVMLIPHYDFTDFHATIAVQASAYGANRRLLFEKTYREEGIGQGGKMFWGGAFGMKSAVRQSSVDAYKKIFEKLRADLLTALNSL